MPFKCYLCKECNGKACIGQMPGMGGPMQNKNFILNCADWKTIDSSDYKTESIHTRLAPMTGAVENAGYFDERTFYTDLINYCLKHNVELSIGDGTPDSKLLYGIEAVQEARKANPDLKAAVFIKPYSNEKIFERLSWAESVTEIAGVDTDAYNIITMRNLVHLEQKNVQQLKELKKGCNKKGIAFAIKGIFTQRDIEIVEQVKPDIAYISNHGGRVETEEGSTAQFLVRFADKIRPNCGKIWIDGGIRTQQDKEKAASYGVDTVLLGRPYITAICREAKQKGYN
ncbi:MAG: alpha-hydroxy-acid oxidizing protein [Treponema sp.]|nr:alpha-hydroxy-acid oxidizing protein [Treponema sp.]